MNTGLDDNKTVWLIIDVIVKSDNSRLSTTERSEILPDMEQLQENLIFSLLQLHQELGVDPLNPELLSTFSSFCCMPHLVCFAPTPRSWN